VCLAAWNASAGGTNGVDHAVSSDAGQTWGTSASLVSTGSVVADPDVALDGNGAAILAYRASGGGSLVHVWTRRGTPGGTFGSAVTAIGGSVVAAAPAVAADPTSGLVVVVAATGTTLPPVTAVRSTDGGATYGAVGAFNSGAWAPGRAPAVACDAGRVVLAWIDAPRWSSQFSGNQVKAVGSADGGTTFGRPVELSLNFHVATGSLDDPDLAFDGAGTCAVTWVEAQPAWATGTGSARMRTHAARSTDGGLTFTPKAILSGGTTGPTLAGRVAGRAVGFRHAWLDDTAASGTDRVFAR
jgi:hypothetical protein